MLPMNVDITTKGKDAVVGLGKVHANLVVSLLFTGVDKGELTRSSKRNTNGNVLCLGTLCVESPADEKRETIDMSMMRRLFSADRQIRKSFTYAES